MLWQATSADPRHNSSLPTYLTVGIASTFAPAIPSKVDFTRSTSSAHIADHVSGRIPTQIPVSGMARQASPVGDISTPIRVFRDVTLRSSSNDYIPT